MKPHRPGSPRPDERPDPRAQRAHHIHLSRRSFLAGAGAIVATGAAAAVFGCEERDTGAPSVAGTSSTPHTTPVPTPNPERGGTLRVYNQDAMPYDSLTLGVSCRAMSANGFEYTRCMRVDSLDVRVKRITLVITPANTYYRPATEVFQRSRPVVANALYR